MFAGEAAKTPTYYLPCDGRTVRQDLYANLYKLIGDNYTPLTARNNTTFSLPDMRSKFPMMDSIGVTGGEATVVLTVDELPNHSHKLRANSAMGNSSDPTSRALSNTAAFDHEYIDVAPNVDMHPGSVEAVGGNNGHSNIPPYLGVTFIIYTGV